MISDTPPAILLPARTPHHEHTCMTAILERKKMFQQPLQKAAPLGPDTLRTFVAKIG
jgi:hypothetical protein